MPIHSLNLYRKPASGNDFIRRYPVYNYRHSIAAVGGFDTMSCDLALTQSEAETFLDQYLANAVKVFVDNPAEPIWEGFINRITYQVGGLTFTASLDEMYNRVSVHYNTASTTNTVGPSDDTDSQAVYGIKQGSVDANLTYGANLADALRTQLIAFAAWPQISTTFGSGEGALLSIECMGWFHTLDWELRADATSALVNASVIVSNCISNLANGTTFFNNADTTLITTNAAFTPNRLQRSGLTAWQVLQTVQEAGDAAGTPWVMGITPTSLSGSRLFYYQPANLAIEYTYRLRDGNRIRNLYGAYVSPWRVQPDRGIRLQDVLIGWQGIGDDPREAYIMDIEYDAESQTVAWQSVDNIEIEGAMQFNRYYKANGRRFGAPPRGAE